MEILVGIATITLPKVSNLNNSGRGAAAKQSAETVGSFLNTAIAACVPHNFSDSTSSQT